MTGLGSFQRELLRLFKVGRLVELADAVYPSITKIIKCVAITSTPFDKEPYGHVLIGSGTNAAG